MARFVKTFANSDMDIALDFLGEGLLDGVRFGLPISLLFLAYKAARLAFEAFLNAFVNSDRVIIFFGRLAICIYYSHIFFTRPSNEYSCFHPIDLIFEQSPNNVSTSHGL